MLGTKTISAKTAASLAHFEKTFMPIPPERDFDQRGDFFRGARSHGNRFAGARRVAFAKWKDTTLAGGNQVSFSPPGTCHRKVKTESSSGEGWFPFFRFACKL